EGSVVSAPGTGSFPSASMKSTCVSTSQSTTLLMERPPASDAAPLQGQARRCYGVPRRVACSSPLQSDDRALVRVADVLEARPPVQLDVTHVVAPVGDVRVRLDGARAMGERVLDGCVEQR